MILQDLVIIVFQILLPLGLLVWLALAPPSNLVGYAIQVIVVGFVLLALCLIPIWLIPPWWTPFVYVAMGIGALTSHVVRRRVPTQPRLPRTIFGWTSATLLALLGTVLGAMSLSALAGRAGPGDAAVNLAFPMGAGTYLVVGRRIHAHGQRTLRYPQSRNGPSAHLSQTILCGRSHQVA